MRKLTAKQQGFLTAYLRNGRNRAEAYRTAYDAKTASPATCSKEGAKLLTHPLIAPQVAQAEASAAAKVGRAADQYAVTQERITAELAKLGFANMLDYMSVGPDGDPVLDYSALTRDQAAALIEVTVEDFKDGRGEDARDVRKVKFKLADKRTALVDLGKHLGMFAEKIEHSGPDGGPIIISSEPMTPDEWATKHGVKP